MARSDLAKAATTRYEFLDLVQAATVADFEDDPDTVKALVAAASISQFEHAAQRARDERERTQRRQAFAAELGEQGITVLGADADATPLHRLTDAEGTNLTDTDHAQCPGHAVTITRRYGQIDPTTGQPVVDELGDEELDDEDFFDEDAEQEGEEPTTVWREYPSAVFVCTDPEGNGHIRLTQSYGYDSGSTKLKLADMNEDDAEAARAQRRDVTSRTKLGTPPNPYGAYGCGACSPARRSPRSSTGPANPAPRYSASPWSSPDTRTPPTPVPGATSTPRRGAT